MVQCCPRCCEPGGENDFLVGDEKHRGHKCSEVDPCGWRKDHLRGQHLEPHDELVCCADRLQARVTFIEQALRALGTPTGGDGGWRVVIRLPTAPVTVHNDVVCILVEVTERLSRISEFLWCRDRASWTNGRGAVRRKPPGGES